MPRSSRIEPTAEVVARVGATALALPDAYEEDAWTGVRWRVRSTTFAHVLVAQEGYTSAYREVTGVSEPTTVLTFRSAGDELLALTNWDEVAELVTESYRWCAPQRLGRLLGR